MSQRTKYKNLLFDLGGVITDLSRMSCVKAFTEMGMTIANELLGEYIQSGPFGALEDGKLSNEEFRAELRKHISATVTDAQIDEAFCKFIVGIPLHRLRALEELRKEYKVYVLSNTNAIMWDSVLKENFAIDGKQREDYFDGIVTSFEAKCSKPDPKIFQLVIDKFGIKAEETLFFDDGKTNIDAASSLGFATHLVGPGEEFMDYFKQ